MLSQYCIEGTINIDNGLDDRIEYNDPNFWKSFQEDYERYRQIITDAVTANTNLVILRVYDGEFLFLSKTGSGEFWKRTHCSKDLYTFDIQQFFDGIAACDYICVQLNTEMFKRYYDILGHIRPIDFPMDFVYASVANRWIFKNFAKDIVIIGGEYKIKAIQECMKFERYRNYLGIDYFIDYISVPERCACDDIDNLLTNIGEQLRHSKGKLVLFGIGMSKMAIAHKFTKYKTAVYVDIGFGVTALSGFGDIRRPYFGNWINFRLRNFDYGDLDKWFCDDDNANNVEYLN